MRVNRSLPGTLMLIVALLLASCDMFPGLEGDGGDLLISINESVSRTLLPDISMDPRSYRIDGTGPAGQEFSVESADERVLIEELMFGDWTVTVTAINADGTEIGRGAAEVTVRSNETVSTSITVTPLVGSGTLSLEVNWNAPDIQSPEIRADLVPVTGDSRILDFTIVEGQGLFFADDIETGYHSLILQLFDNGQLVAGLVEVVRIVHAERTEGVIDFYSINPATGGLQVQVELNLQNPLHVNIAAPALEKAVNESIELHSHVSDYPGNVTYLWYVNGEVQEAGSSYTLDESWEEGFYTVNVTAFTPDGLRAGSAGVDLTVAGFSGLDFANPNNYVSLPASYSRTMEFWGDFAYVFDSNRRELKVYSLLDPDLPALAHQISTDGLGNVYNMIIVGDYLYLPQYWDNTMDTFDVVRCFAIQPDGGLDEIGPVFFTPDYSLGLSTAHFFLSEQYGDIYLFERGYSYSLHRYVQESDGSLTLLSTSQLPGFVPEQSPSPGFAAGSLHVSTYRRNPDNSIYYFNYFYGISENGTVNLHSRYEGVDMGYSRTSAGSWQVLNYSYSYTLVNPVLDVITYPEFTGYSYERVQSGDGEYLFTLAYDPVLQKRLIRTHRVNADGSLDILGHVIDKTQSGSMETAGIHKGRVYYTGGST